MNRIHILPDILANQIAAGEVVERPASVIKEIIENSIDAGSSRIQIEIELGGRRLMRIADNGHGMSRDDAVIAFERHATSKISSLEDLGAIATLGFRGEALASIASVAKVELVTKQENELAGTRVEIDGGRLVDVGDAGRATGTTISVRDLFFNTPARRKFMRSEATENYHIASIVTHYALANPSIAFVLTNNGREVVGATPAGSLKERAFQLFGEPLIESLLPVAGGRSNVAAINGFVSAPRERRTNRDAQYFFVNNRYVRDRTVADGLREGFQSVLPHGVYPVAFLFIDLPLEEIDVNVHPAKTQVKFRRTEAVKEAIAEAVRNALASAGIVAAPLGDLDEVVETEPATSVDVDTVEPQAEMIQGEMTFPEQPSASRQSFVVPFVANPASGAAAARTEVSDPQLAEHPSIFSNADIPRDLERAAAARSEIVESPADVSATEPMLPPVNSAERFIRAASVDEVSRRKIRPVGQLHESFIIAVDDEGLLLVDQHVAHERILFDKFRRAETQRSIESQNLLIPETFDLSPAQAEAFALIEPELESLGFGVMRLSGRTVAIKSIPTDLPSSETRNLFAEILDSFEADKRGRAKSVLRDDIAASLACKAAIKINMKLTDEKMEWLIDRLLTTSSPTTCPHGRPVILRLSMKDIERGFHRT